MSPVHFGKTEVLSKYESGFGVGGVEITDVNMSEVLTLQLQHEH